MRTLFLLALLITLGAGCAKPVPAQPAPPQDRTPGVNEENCRASGGTVDGDSCKCPTGYRDDPAGFCLDAQGIPGGTMAPN